MHDNRKTSFNLNEVGKRFKELRTDRHTSLMNMSEDLQISRNTISKYEDYPNSMSLSTLLLYEDYFDTSVAYLLFGKNILSPNDISLAHELFMKWGRELLQEIWPDLKNLNYPFK